MNEKGNGGNLDDDGEDVRSLSDTMGEVELERSHVLLGDNRIGEADEGEMSSLLLHIWDTMDPDEFKIPKALDDWVGPTTNTAMGGTTFDKVDNQDGWSRFSYRPEFLSGAQGGQYKFYCLPSDCQSVLTNEDNATIHTHGGWFFLPREEEGGI